MPRSTFEPTGLPEAQRPCPAGNLRAEHVLGDKVPAAVQELVPQQLELGIAVLHATHPWQRDPWQQIPWREHVLPCAGCGARGERRRQQQQAPQMHFAGGSPSVLIARSTDSPIRRLATWRDRRSHAGVGPRRHLLLHQRRFSDSAQPAQASSQPDRLNASRAPEIFLNRCQK